MCFNQKGHSGKYLRMKMKLIIQILTWNRFLHYQNYKLKMLFAVPVQAEFPICGHEVNSNWQYPVPTAKQ